MCLVRRQFVFPVISMMLGITCGFVLAVSGICALPVEKLPILTELDLEVLYKVGGNSRLKLQCSTVGHEDGVEYSWLKDGKPFESRPGVLQREGEGTIIFREPTIEDQGEYRCIANTGLGVTSSRPISVRRTYIDAPEIKTQRHKPVEGRPFKLDCHLPNGYPRPEIEWIYRSAADPSISRVVLDYRITKSPGGTLFFTNVTKDDVSSDHKYVCVAKLDDEEVILAEHILEDMLPGDGNDAELVPLYVSQDMITKVGDVTMIYCIYGGTPLAFPDWYKDGNNSNNDPKDRVTRYNRTGGKRLLIKDTWLSDQGEYTCIVDNEVGKPQNHTMHLTVVSAPQFQKHSERIVIAKAGETLVLPCQVAGVPLPQLSWTFDTQPLQNAVLHQESHGNLTVADLTLKNVKKEDTGYYGCEGTNEHGTVYIDTLVYVQ